MNTDTWIVILMVVSAVASWLGYMAGRLNEIDKQDALTKRTENVKESK